MVQVRPFRGLRFDPKVVGNPNLVVAPPYDVISPEEQQQLHEKNPYNIVRLILGLKHADDTETSNVYTRSHETLEAWRREGALKPDETPAVYAYSQSWANLERRGFIAALGLADYKSGQILPHEYTLGGPKADRLSLMKATGSVLSPIFCLYDDPAKRIEDLLFGSWPDSPLELRDKDAVLHRFWPVSNPAVISEIQILLKDKAVLIADGHHRYETAVAYRDWRRSTEGQESVTMGQLPWDYTMAFFTNMADEGLKVYPTHRIFTGFPQGFTAEKLLQEIARYFEPVDSDEAALFWIEQHGSTPQGYRVKADADISGIPQPLRKLDVSYIDHLIFQGILNQPASQLKQDGLLHFERDEDAIQNLLKQGALVFRMHAPSVQDVRDICQSGYRMPQKSTYFYPKLLSGLALYYYGPESTPKGPAFQPLPQGAELSV